MKNLIILIAFMPLLLSCEKEGLYADEIKTQTGESFDIELEANWSTGYHWSWMNSSDICTVDSIDLNYIIEDPGLGGTSGTEVWTFKAKSIGEEVLVFTYRGPGATQNDAGETKEFKVLVSD
jgi:predicted secreted protein